MKIRNGFVSNSSSSSFILITSEENHQRAYDRLNDFQKSVLDHIRPEKRTLFGVPVFAFEIYDGDEGEYYEMAKYHLADPENPIFNLGELAEERLDEDVLGQFISQAFSDYTKILSEKKDHVWQTTINY